jgi:uncharacterized membrane protein
MNAPLLFGAVAMGSYALMSHQLMLHAAAAPWAVAALFGPLLLVPLAMAWRQRQPALLAAALVGAAALVAVVAAGGLGDVRRLYLAQHMVVHLALGASFAWTLAGGRTALITRLARRVHRVSPAMAVYTRSLTRLWVGYFFGMAALSLAVFALLPWTAWSLLANLLTPLAITGLFVGEHALRYRLHPEFERVTLGDMLRAYRQRDASEAPGR